MTYPHVLRTAKDWLWRAILPSGDHGNRPVVKARTLVPLFVPLFSVNLLVLALCAPHIKVDSSVYTAMVMRDFVVPHGAPLYPIFVRSVNAVVHNSGVLIGSWPAAEGTTWSLMHPVPYSNFSIYAILVAQHVLLAWAAAWFAGTITTRRWLRVTTAAALGWSPPILMAAQRIMTEALWNPLVIAAIAACYRVLVQPRKPLRDFALHFTFVALAMMVRHPGNVFLAILPLSLVILGIARATSRRQSAVLLPHLRAAVVASCIGLVTLGMVSRIKTAVLVACDVEPRSAFGRPGTQRIHYKALHPYEGISCEEMNQIIHGLKRRAEDPQVQRAIWIIATSDSFWSEPFNRIRTEIVEPAFPQYNWRQTLAPTDRLLNQAAWLAYTSTDPRMLRSVALRATRFLQLGPDLKWFGIGPLSSLSESMDLAAGAAEWAWLKKNSLADVSEAKDVHKLRRTLALEWIAAVVRPPETRLLWLSIVALTVLVIARGRFGPGAGTAIAVVTTAVIYAFLSAVVAGYSARRSEIVVLLAVCGTALLYSELTERSD